MKGRKEEDGELGLNEEDYIGNAIEADSEVVVSMVVLTYWQGSSDAPSHMIYATSLAEEALSRLVKSPRGLRG